MMKKVAVLLGIFAVGSIVSSVGIIAQAIIVLVLLIGSGMWPVWVVLGSLAGGLAAQFFLGGLGRFLVAGSVL